MSGLFFERALGVLGDAALERHWRSLWCIFWERRETRTVVIGSGREAKNCVYETRVYSISEAQRSPRAVDRKAKIPAIFQTRVFSCLRVLSSRTLLEKI